MKAVVFGATGGIGAALTWRLAQRADIDEVFACSRSGEGPAGAAITPLSVDVLSEESLAEAATRIKEAGGAALVIVAIGLLSDGDALQPEKTYRHQTLPAFEQVFAINTFAPGLIAKHMLPLMPRRGRAVFAALSARVGSISDNRLGGWHAYRASKAALNMLIRNYAIEQARRSDDFIAVSLHPGTVDTGLSKPFQGNVPEKKLFTPDQSAGYLLSVIDGLTPTDTGKAFDWAGEPIPA
ncbi:MAG: SDR family NAD(P)-dependent oxidoreductase [Pseudomonadota bacterium]